MVDFKSIIKEQREELEEIERTERVIPREHFNEAKHALKHPNILAILGIRRCGKSLFSYLLTKGYKTGYINFDDERLFAVQAEDFDKILTSFYELYGNIDYIILDEIQNMNHWELFVNRLRRTKRVIVTGSNSKLLSGELATHLTGRYLDVKLFPFSFREYLLKKGFQQSKAYTSRERAEIIKHLQEYMHIGGFPEVYKFGRAIIIRIYEDIITKDILLRYQINKSEDLKKLAHYLITNTAQEVTYNKLTEIIGVKRISTISTWISYLEQAFLFTKVERFDFKLKQQFKAPKKFYSADPGLFHSIAFQFSSNVGRLMENVVAIELQRRKKTIYYWKDHQQHEVDFVIKEGKKIRELIQVTHALNKSDVKDREILGLAKACKHLKCKNMTIITWEYEDTEQDIRFVPLWKWLLESK